MRSKEVERANCSTTQAQGKTMDRTESLGESPGSESWPSPVALAERLVHNRDAISKTVHTWPFVNLNLKELQHPHRFTRRGNELQLTFRRRQHDPGGINVNRLHTAIAEHSKNVDHVVVVDQVICEFYQGCDQKRFSSHRSTCLPPAPYPERLATEL